MEKYKIRKRKKALNPMLVFFAFGTCMFLVACGYAMFSDNLEIDGTANFKPVIKEDDEASMLQVGDVFTPMPEVNEYSSSKYTYKTISNWQQGDKTYIYQVNLEITNLEEDFTSGNIEVSFEEINGLFEKQSQENLGITQAEKVLISGNKITILLTETNSVVKYGDKINILAYLTYEEEQPEGITIQNVTLNGKLLSKDTLGNEDTSDKSDTDSKNEVNANTLTTNTTVNTNDVGNETDNQEQQDSTKNQSSSTSKKDEEKEEL